MKNVIILLLVVASMVTGIAVIYKMLTITEVRCESQYGPCSDELVGQIDVATGYNYFQARSRIVNALEKSSKVNEYDIRFQIPPSFNVFVDERKATLALQYSDNRFILVDQEGKIIGEATETQLPAVKINNSNDLDDIKYLADIIGELNSYYDFNDFRLEDYALRARYGSTIEVVLPRSGDIDVILGSIEVVLFRLNSIIQESTIVTSNSQIKQIDFRFKNPVIKYFES